MKGEVEGELRGVKGNRESRGELRGVEEGHYVFVYIQTFVGNRERENEDNFTVLFVVRWLREPYQAVPRICSRCRNRQFEC